MTRKPPPAAPTFDAADLARDAELRALVEATPLDDAAISVYADWLEERGDHPRASFLRFQQQLRGMQISHPKLLERGRALFALGKQLPAAWVDAITWPKLGGTAWDGADDNGALVWRFLPDGTLNYTQPSGTYENGGWEQIGNTVAMDTNAHYAEYFGVIVEDVMRGDGRNLDGYTWRWKVTLTEAAEVANVPGAVIRTINDDEARARLARVAKPRPAPKPKPKPLQRNARLQRKAKLATKRKPSRGR